MRFNPFGTGRGLSTYLKRQFYLPRIVSIPLEQGGVFRRYCWFRFCYWRWVSIPLEQGEVFRHEININIPYSRLFQSLWNRAGSFDKNSQQVKLLSFVSIPLEQGEVFRLRCWMQADWDSRVSIPLEQGGVFRPPQEAVEMLRKRQFQSL